MSTDPSTSADQTGGQQTSRRTPCSDCDRPMRPRGVTLEEEPNTVAWGHSGKCKGCVQPNTNEARPDRKRRGPRRKAPEEVRHAHNVNALNSFLARRYRRGIQPETDTVYRPGEQRAA